MLDRPHSKILQATFKAKAEKCQADTKITQKKTCIEESKIVTTYLDRRDQVKKAHYKQMEEIGIVKLFKSQ